MPRNLLTGCFHLFIHLVFLAGWSKIEFKGRKLKKGNKHIAAGCHYFEIQVVGAPR